MFPMKGVEVQSLVRKLRSHMPMPSSVTKQHTHTHTHTHTHIHTTTYIYIHTHAHIYLYIHIYIVRNVLEKFILNVDRLQFWLGKFWKPLLKRSTGWLSLFSTDHTNRNPLFQWRKTALSLRSAEGDIF